MLWIAYDLWLTRDLFQLRTPAATLRDSCELLTIFDLQEIYSNPEEKTAKKKELWIAYDLWLTRDLFQPLSVRFFLADSCELLTIFDLQEIYSNTR